jgi:uncharacterized membrane protein
MNSQFPIDEKDRMRHDPDNYIWGIFYFNREDPRFIVPKRNQWMGWTLNFASPFSYLLLLGIIVFGIVMG